MNDLIDAIAMVDVAVPSGKWVLLCWAVPSCIKHLKLGEALNDALRTVYGLLWVAELSRLGASKAERRRFIRRYARAPRSK